ncbi:homeobox-domain-containing protein [Rhizopus microsporus var. microsporus]|uniref:Homeobox-domain-containing protein n=2 Tax=Rhizopus microsporus TaxID=58291 RepID=A0A1X0RJ41_RHIZD|nr:homeobox-domain-containing protein [Rhizopus microsporus var. microsporus]
MNPSITTVNENQYLKQIKSSRLTKKKRARATPDQVSVLEGVFAINISPNSKLRRQLAEQLNMNERSVQIWFQNKRAKIKNLQKKARLQQDTIYLPSPKTLSSSFMLSFQKDMPFQFTAHSQQYFPQSNININHASPYCSSLVNPPGVYSSSNVTPSLHRYNPDNLFTNNPSLLPLSYTSNTNCHLSASSLSIGTWHRFGLHASHLTCLYDSGQHSFIWYITDNAYHFKMQIPLASIRLIEFVRNSFSARHTDQTGVYQDQSDVHFHMCQPPLFYMRYLSNKGTNSDHWIQCSDFTENKQASDHFRHIIKGETEAIRQDILQLCHVHEDVRKLIRIVDNPTPSGQNISRLDSLPSMPVYPTHGLCPPTPSHYGLPSFPTLSTSRISNEEFLII